MALEGQQLGRYRLVRLLGSGGMGEVYLAEDARIQQQVAIKVIRSEVTPYPGSQTAREAARLFEREATAIAKLDHPNILPLFEYGEENVQGATLTYIVMPYRKEGTLATWLRERGNTDLLSPQDVAYFIQQAAEALQHAHDNSVIHQDIKPSNFLIRVRKDHPGRPELLLADFGIAKFSTATANVSQSIRGTPAYMPPEQWEGRPVPASDQYALAVMAYQLLTGHPPFQGRMEQVMRQHFAVQPQSPSTLNPRLSPAIDAVILRALAKNPADRFASVTDFAAAAQLALATLGPGPTYYGPPIPPQMPTPDRSLNRAIRTTLALSAEEASGGANRLLNLPGGRQVAVSVPAGAYDGQVIRLVGQGEPSLYGEPAGDLVLTIAVRPPAPPSGTLNADSSAPTINSIPPPPPVSGRIESSGLPRRSRWKGMLVIALVLLVVLGSGVFLLSGTLTNQAATNNANATATRQANMHATATAIAQATVNVSASQVAATAQAIATADAIGLHNPYGGTLALSDPLQDNSKGYGWAETSDSYGSCQFKGGAYHASLIKVGYFYQCLAQNPDFSNFTFQVEMTIIKGNYGGIVFRDTEAQSQRYYLRIGRDGSYNLYCYSSDTTICTSALVSNTSRTIKRGLNQTNIVTVVAYKDYIYLYINGQYLISLNDANFSHGQIGVVADGINAQAEVVFRNARVWTF